MLLHAGLVALRIRGLWTGALILGSSGSGKSDLMLRAIDQGFRLVADDRVLVWASGGRLYGRAPASLHGLIEARGLGVEREGALPLAHAALAVDCDPGEIERVPSREAMELEGVRLPRLKLAPLESSAPAKLCRALMRLGQGPSAA